MSKPSSIHVVAVVAVDTTVTGAGGVGVAVCDGVTVVAVPDVPEPGLWEMTAAEAAGTAIAPAIPSAHPESHHSLAKRAAPPTETDWPPNPSGPVGRWAGGTP